MALSLYSFSFLFVNFTPIELAVFSKRTSSLYSSQKKRFSLFFLTRPSRYLEFEWLVYSRASLLDIVLSDLQPIGCVCCVYLYTSPFSLSLFISLFVFFCSISDAFWRVSVQVNQRGYIVETKEASSDFSLAAGQPGLSWEKTPNHNRLACT